MKPATRMLLMRNGSDERRERDDKRRGAEMRYNGDYEARHDTNRYPRYDGREEHYTPPESRYDMMDDTEMRGTRRRRYDNGRFRPTRGGADYLKDPEDDDDDTEARCPYMPERIPPMGQIGFTAGGGHGKVTEMHRGGSRMMESRKLDKATAEEWMRSMKNEDGTTGPHWSMEAAKQVMAQKGVTGEPVEFWVTLNMVYSDYCKVAKKLGLNTMDFYVEMAKAFLDDKDAGDDKLMRYYEYVVK